MSCIRFMHSDNLRLGSAIQGLSDSPEWLRRITVSGVRQSVRNLFEAAAAARCHFVLIAGRITESEQDLDIVVQWLRQHLVFLREHRIRLVMSARTEAEALAFSKLDAFLIRSGDCAEVRVLPSGEIDIHAGRSSFVPAETLRIEIGSGVRSGNGLSYRAEPGAAVSNQLVSSDGTLNAWDGFLRLSAGPPQAIEPSERGPCGGLLVEADPRVGSLVARFCPSDVIRFTQESLSFPDGSTFTHLQDELRSKSRSLAGNRCTVAAEWILDGQFSATIAEADSFTESNLLRDLRSSLHAGHSGAWPCRIRFSETSGLRITERHSTLLREFCVTAARRHAAAYRSVVNSIDTLPLSAGSEGIGVVRSLRKAAG